MCWPCLRSEETGDAYELVVARFLNRSDQIDVHLAGSVERTLASSVDVGADWGMVPALCSIPPPSVIQHFSTDTCQFGESDKCAEGCASQLGRFVRVEELSVLNLATQNLARPENPLPQQLLQ